MPVACPEGFAFARKYTFISLTIKEFSREGCRGQSEAESSECAEKTVDLKDGWVYIHDCQPKEQFELCNFVQSYARIQHHTWAEAHLLTRPVRFGFRRNGNFGRVFPKVAFCIPDIA
jgi:hypothetical protein